MHSSDGMILGANMVLANSIVERKQDLGLYGCRIKGILDVIFAVVMLVVLAPLMLIVALAIMLDSPGPAIYRQTRVGKFGKSFRVCKFRTMDIDAPVLSTEDMQKLTVIPYTRIGSFLRKTSLDELPQLFNIIEGQMSFIGPRPALPSQTDVNELREQMNAHRIKPGITGLAQAMGRDNLDNATKVSYDAKYSRSVSLLLDIKILMMTASAVICARGNK
ncbi:MAG: sugar transferase [Armatimonadetes bacterium]|nr:sugar transferase [Armatimonadota bacterium]